MILEYISFENMVNCMRVSKGWRDYLAKRPKLWLHLDMSGARKPVPRSFVGNAVRRSESRLNRLTVHRFEHMDVLKNIAKACKGLTDIEFVTLPHTVSSTLIDIVQCAPSLRRFVVHPEISTDTVAQILRYQSSLEHVGLSGVTSSQVRPHWKGSLEALNTLSIHMVEIWSAQKLKIEYLMRLAPNLQSLTLSNMKNLTVPTGWPDVISQLPPLIHLSLKRIQFSHRLVLFPSTLQRLEVETDGVYKCRNHDFTRQPFLPKLTHLKLWGLELLSAGIFENLLDTPIDATDADEETVRGATPLQSLSVHCLLEREERDNGLFNGPDSLFGRSRRILTPALTSLDIATLRCDDDEIEHLLSQHETGIQSIDLSCTNITGASIKMLADKLPSLKTIKADNCTKINGRDAIHYAERKGISVSCRMGEQRGGRTIRY